jgi:hypothetical protein
MRHTTVVFEKTLMRDAKEPETILGGWRNVVDSAPRRGEYF